MTDTPKISFSKKVVIGVAAAATVSMVACTVLTVCGIDCDRLYDITLALIGAFTGSECVYKWKEKAANKAKYAQMFVMEFADKYGIDAAIQIAEVVLRD